MSRVTESSILRPRVEGRRVTLQIRDGNVCYHFDRTGRFVFAVEPGRVVRRGLDHRMLEITMTPGKGSTARRYRDLTPEEGNDLLKHIYRHISQVYDGVHSLDARWLDRILGWQARDLATDFAAFQQVYKPVSILPPDQYHSLVVQVAEGCSYNRCLFCDFYRDRPFHIKSMAELKRHLDGITEFLGDRLFDRSGVFLGDGNALVVPTAKLLDMMSLIRKTLGETADHMFTFMDTFSLGWKTDEELQSLCNAHLDTIYIGLETGADTLRTFLAKQGTADEAAGAIKRLKEAGFRIGVIALVGAGGEEYREEHFQKTMELFSQLPLAPDDILYLSPLVVPQGTPYADRMQGAHLTPLTPEELASEMQRWRSSLVRVHPAKVSLYSILEHIY